MKTQNHPWPAVALCLLATLAPAAAHSAATYPERPIRMIVPFPPAGSNDMLGRYLGQKLTDRLGQQIVIDNRSGASGIIGAEIAAGTPADGYSLLFISVSHAVNSAVRRKLPYDLEKSFDPISPIASAPSCLVVNPKGQYHSLAALITDAKARPGALSYASTGIGSINHVGGELLKKLAGIDMVHVGYKGGGPAMTDVIAGNIPVMFSSLIQTLPHVRAGRLKVLAMGSPQRSSLLPDVPTVAESGYPGYDVTVWWGVMAPAGVPQARMNRLLKEVNAVLDLPETQQRLVQDAAVPLKSTPAGFRKMIHDEIRKWKAVAQQANIRL